MQSIHAAPTWSAAGSKHVILVEVDAATHEQLKREARRHGVSFADAVRVRLTQAPLANTLAVAQNPSAN